MDSRERTFLALNHEEPDRIPTDFWASRALKVRLGVPFEAFQDAHDIDLRYVEGPRYVGPPLQRAEGGLSEDIWGVWRRAVTVPTPHGTETYDELATCPLAGAQTPEDVAAYGHWPSPDWFDYGEIEAQCRRVRERGRVVVFEGDRLNRIAQLKPAMYLRGVGAIFEDMALRPELAHAIIARIRAFCLGYLERILAAACGNLDIVLTGDDFGAQNGPLVSPRMWTEFLAPGFAAYTSLIKAHGARVMHHTCGGVRLLIPLLIERGLDVLQALQPEAAGMDARGLKADFGSRLSFQGGISIQQTLPFGSPEDVRRAVQDRVEALGAGGGYILCTSHNIQADTPPGNVAALLDAYRQLGRYR